MRILLAFTSVFLVSAAFLPAISAQAVTPTTITLLHTNDLHSHFRGDKTLLGLGGVARLKTAIRRIRSNHPQSLLVDGGDWSEGNIYYNEGAGRETLRMMDHLGYDVAVVGNHDWFNGADTLLTALTTANPSLTLLASNIETSDFDRENEFRRRIPPYVIKDVGGVKIAFIGLLTFEKVYDKFMLPIKITEPFALTRELSHKLKKLADLVVVVSHNSINVNKGVLLAAPEVDLVIGAHDHVKLTHPVVVNRPFGKPAWIVEAGCWGRYLGRVDLKVTPRDPAIADSKAAVEFVQSSLVQMDSSVPEDPETLARLATLEAQIESHRGPIFHDHIGDNGVELSRYGMENLMGDFATDAYLKATGAELAVDQTNFIYNELHEGQVNSVDVYNANPGVYSPKTEKAWTINLIPLSGKTLSWILNLLLSSKTLAQDGPLNFSGVEMIFNPLFAKNSTESSFGNPFGTLQAPGDGNHADGLTIKSFKIQGQEIQADHIYKVAIPGGVVNALQFLDVILPGSVPLNEMHDTGIEGWRAMADYLHANSPFTMEKIQFGKRLRTVQTDLGILPNDVWWEPLHRDAGNRMVARVHVRVRNTGTLSSQAGTSENGPRVALLLNQNGVNYSIDPVYVDAASAQALPVLSPEQTTELVWENVPVPESLGLFAITARILGSDSEVNRSNDEVTKFF